MNRKEIEDRARQVASNTFSSGTMRTMLYEMICEAFGAPQVSTREVTPAAQVDEGAGDADCG